MKKKVSLKWSVSLIFIFLICSTLGKIDFAVAMPPDNEPLVTLSLKHEPMKNVVAEVVAQTGYIVEFDESLNEILITGEFESIKLTTFFRKILKNKNPFITVSEEEKIIAIQTVLSSKAETNLPRRIQDKTVSIVEPQNTTQRNEGWSSNSNERLGGIDELPPLPPTKPSGNTNHIIDPQTGKNWNEAEQMLP